MIQLSVGEQPVIFSGDDISFCGELISFSLFQKITTEIDAKNKEIGRLEKELQESKAIAKYYYEWLNDELCFDCAEDELTLEDTTKL